jgi:hypothetical protein
MYSFEFLKLQGHTGFVMSVAFRSLTIEMATKALADTIRSSNLQFDVACIALSDKNPTRCT